MPFVFLSIGALLLTTGIIGDAQELWQLLESDFTGANSFLYWFLAMLVLGSLGYIEKLKGLSRLFMALVLVVLLLNNKGFFTQLQSFIGQSQSSSSSTSGSTTGTPSGVGTLPTI